MYKLSIVWLTSSNEKVAVPLRAVSRAWKWPFEKQLAYNNVVIL